MSRADELRAVQARVKDATEGGPDLDEAIHAVLLPNDPWWQSIVEGRRLVAAGDPEAYVICPPTGPLGGDNRMRAVSWAEGARVAAYSTSLDDAKRLVVRMLPGFWHSTTTCWRTADADVAPDFTGPHGDDLLAAGWSLEEHDAVTFSAVVAPGGPIHAECLALIAAMLKALIAKEALVPPSLEMLVKRRTALAFMKAAPTRSALITQEVEHGR